MAVGEEKEIQLIGQFDQRTKESNKNSKKKIIPSNGIKVHDLVRELRQVTGESLDVSHLLVDTWDLKSLYSLFYARYLIDLIRIRGVIGKSSLFTIFFIFFVW